MLYSHNARQLMRPASTMKLLTAITALDCLGPVYRFTTSLYYIGTISQGRLQGDIICVGGMDPLFERRDMLAFVEALKQKGITSIRGSIIVDNSMKDANKWGEGWCWDDDNPTLTPLLINRRPKFGEQLLRELRTAGVTVSGARVVPGQLPANGAVHICTRSHGIDEVMLPMMKESDNLLAESTYYQIAASTGHHPASASDARQVELALLNRIGLEGFRYGLADGSGLSLYNYLTAEAEVMLLRFAFFQQRVYQALLPTLPVSGVDGTLRARMKETPAEGLVQAKTGTLTGISSLAGYLTAPNGHRLCFCIINQGLKRASDGRRFQDALCIALTTP
jgi:D-alanyl-D-alanine carboxypeptidase/D-alanyl-D-alanine-endopeptidase (penicillin-binding protein 4)